MHTTPNGVAITVILRKKQFMKGLTALGLLAVLLLTFQGMNMSSYQNDSYAPGAIVMDRYLNDVETVLITGQVLRFNTTTFKYDPLINTQVRFWATDELFEDLVTTDDAGYFKSNKYFQVGQLITLTIFDLRFTRFISYYAEIEFQVDTIYM